MLKTRDQSKVSISGLTYNNLIEDAYNALRDSDAFKNNFTDFTSNTAERMIVELYAYVATQLANRLDQMGNELFVDTASASGLSRLLKLVGAKVDFPAAASVDVTVTTSSNTYDVPFTSGIDDGSDELKYITGSFKSVTANNGTNWEFIDRKVEDGRFVYDYTTKYDFQPASQTVTVYEGTTHSLEYTIRSINTDIITLSNSPVIKDSVRVYYKKKAAKTGTTNLIEIVEFKKVDNFFTTEALTATTGIFTERNMGDGRCELCLKPYNSESESDLGKELLIMYRTGGGEDGNIAVGGIDKTERFGITDENGRITNYGLLNIYNAKTGNGGKNELTTDEIRATVLQEVRNTKIAVTEEDYEYLLPKYDNEIELIKCYGEKNSEIANLAETYGYYVNPVTVWLIILKSNTGFSKAYLDDVAGLTDRINDIAFSTLDINPRFNEKYQVNKAYLNQMYGSGEYENYFDEDTHTYTFPIKEEGIELLASGNAKITVTNYPYIESSLASKRGVKCFKRYDTLTGTSTWAEIMTKASATKGDVYIVTNEDYYGEVNNRWLCKQTYSGVTLDNNNVLTYWEKVDFAYIYDNLVSDNISQDIMYIQQSSDPSVFNPVYSEIDHAFSGNWEELREEWGYGEHGVQIPNGDTIYLTIDGAQIPIPGGTIFETGEDLCTLINSKVAAETQLIMLKQNVTASISEQPDSKQLPLTGTSYADITLVTNDTTSNVRVDTSGAITYGDLYSRINSVLPSAYRAIWVENNSCWNLAIICATEFTYRDKAESLADDSALYVNILDNTEPDEWPIASEAFVLSSSQAADPTISSYLSIESGATIARYEDGKVIIGFGDTEETSILIESTDVVRENVFKGFFGINASTEEAVVSEKRILTAIYTPSESGDMASLQIVTTSKDDLLPENSVLYINIFGGLNGEIKLGSYYEEENIEKNFPDTPEVVRELLVREPISHLYSTSYISDDFETRVDKYGSDYQLKFSAGLIGEQTFNQLSSGKSPAKITTLRTSTTSTLYYPENSYLYMKVDNVDYDGTGEFTVNGTTHIVPEADSYAQFDLSWFNNSTTDDFAEGIITTFSNQGGTDPETGETLPLLLKVSTVKNTITIYTLSSTYYSSIDFGSTSITIINDLFGIETSVVHSDEGQIDVEQIKYKYYPFTGSFVIGNSMQIDVTPANQTTLSATVNTGYSVGDFTNNVANSEVGEYVIIDDNRIILLDLTNGSKIKVTLRWEDAAHKLAWKNMFSTIWNSFEIDDPNGIATLEFVNSGDYYIDVRKNEETKKDEYILVIQNEDAFPFGDIYFHMYEDYSNDHVVRVVDNSVIYTDEYNWNNLMLDKKVMITEHVYKQPRFIPFDLAITCYLPNTEAYSQTDYYKEIGDYIRTEYGLYSDNVGKEILPDDIRSNITENFSKILKVTVDYLGYDLTNPSTNQDSLITEFNQKHILASTSATTGTVVDPDTGFITVQENVINHGLKITLKYKAAS